MSKEREIRERLSACEEFLTHTVSEGDVILAAVSGGVDSMAMLDVLLSFQQAIGYRVVVGHIHHHLREASDGEWDFVEAHCAAWGVPFYGRHIDVRQAQSESGRSMETEAHRLRHQALEEIRLNVSAQWIALAHHANDRAETVLMNLLRGTSGNGLAAMTARNGVLIRPLLTLTREEIETYCLNRGISWVNDESNADTTILRNRLRHELMPMLGEYNPAIVDAFNRLAESCEWEQDYINDSASNLLENSTAFAATQWRLVKRAAWKSAHEAVQAAALRQCAEQYCVGRHNLRFEMVKQVLALIQSGHGRYDLGGGLMFECSKAWIYIGRQPHGQWYKEAQEWRHDFLEAALRIDEAAAVRFAVPGDAIRLANLGHKRLKKIFQEKGVPSCLRGVWPLIYDIKTKEVIWVPFLAQSSLLMYYNSVTFSKVHWRITIAGKSGQLTF